MPASPKEKIQTLLINFLGRVLSTRKRLERGHNQQPRPLRRRALHELDVFSAAARAFRNAAATIAAGDPPQWTSIAKNHRLAEFFRYGGADAIAAEPELTAAAQVLDLAQDYFAAAAARTANPGDPAGAVLALRHLLADQIAQGLRPVLKPAFKQEYDAFKRDYLARRRSVAPSARCPAGRQSDPENGR